MLKVIGLVNIWPFDLWSGLRWPTVGGTIVFYDWDSVLFVLSKGKSLLVFLLLASLFSGYYDPLLLFVRPYELLAVLGPWELLPALIT